MATLPISTKRLNTFAHVSKTRSAQQKGGDKPFSTDEQTDGTEVEGWIKKQERPAELQETN